MKNWSIVWWGTVFSVEKTCDWSMKHGTKTSFFPVDTRKTRVFVNEIWMSIWNHWKRLICVIFYSGNSSIEYIVSFHRSVFGKQGTCVIRVWSIFPYSPPFNTESIQKINFFCLCTGNRSEINTEKGFTRNAPFILYALH